MSYFAIDSEIVVDFPQSESLHKAVYYPSSEVLDVFYASNVDFAYEHHDCDYDEFQRFLALVDHFQSGNKGYNAWKDERKQRLQLADKQRFEAFWNGLNEYQRDNLIEFISEKRLEHWTIKRIPISWRKRTWAR